MKFQELLNEQLDPVKVIAGLFDQSTRKTALAKDKGFLTKLFSGLGREVDNQDKNVTKVLINMGFSKEEVDHIRAAARASAKEVTTKWIKKLEGTTKQELITRHDHFFRYFFSSSAMISSANMDKYYKELTDNITTRLKDIY